MRDHELVQAHPRFLSRLGVSNSHPTRQRSLAGVARPVCPFSSAIQVGSFADMAPLATTPKYVTKLSVTHLPTGGSLTLQAAAGFRNMGPGTRQPFGIPQGLLPMKVSDI